MSCYWACGICKPCIEASIEEARRVREDDALPPLEKKWTRNGAGHMVPAELLGYADEEASQC